MKVVFRVDASIEIGNGHVMRCLTLADALRQRGVSCHFICREHLGNLFDYIRERGYDVCKLPPSKTSTSSEESLPAYVHWLGADWAGDAEQTLAGFDGNIAEWLVVDHYALDVRWEERIRSAYRRLMVIDDLADRHHNCDLLLDQNLGRDPADYHTLVPSRSVMLVGAQYALLRPEFAALRSRSLARRVTPSLKRLLITMGGVDKDNVTGNVLLALSTCQLPADCKITTVMGLHAPWLDSIRAQASDMPWPTDVKVNVNNMAQLMTDCDLAIGAAGSTSWERCALGVPTFMAVLANNQKEAAKALKESGAAEIIYPSETLHSTLQVNIQRLLDNPAHLQSLSNNAASLCDGQGVARVLARLLS
jgi:UDP-2,4-diacetamido-2,4,6-trideoxy-beta-L-altropyranose hydrolase